MYTENRQTPTAAARQFLTQKLAPQDLYPAHGKFEDADTLRGVAIAILTEQILTCPMDLEEMELVRFSIRLLTDPETEQWQWSAMKQLALYQIGSDVADVVCHLVSAARTPRIGVAGLRTAGKDVIRLKQDRCSTGDEAREYMRKLFKHVGGPVSVFPDPPIDPAYADWRLSNGDASFIED